MYRLWPHRAKNALRKSDNHILRNPRYSSDAALFVQHWRHNGAFFSFPVLAYMLLRLHSAGQEKHVAQKRPQYEKHCQVSRVCCTNCVLNSLINGLYRRKEQRIVKVSSFCVQTNLFMASLPIDVGVAKYFVVVICYTTQREHLILSISKRTIFFSESE